MDSLPLPVRCIPLVAILLVPGCAPKTTRTTSMEDVITERYISAGMLASRLGMSVERQSRAVAILSDRVNTLVIFPGDTGRTLVNSRPVGPTGTALAHNGKIYIRTDRQEPLKAALRPIPTPRPTPRPVRPVRPKTIDAVIVVDAGHGGKDPGAKGVSPIPEEDLVLSIARNLEGELHRRGARVIMTRTSDRYIELDDRAAIAERHHADLLVSIHADSARRRSASGITVYIARAASTDSFRAANRIERAFRKAGFTSRGIRRADFRVLAGHSRPAVLFEAGYLTNPNDASRLCDPAHRARISRILADAIISLFK